ncbi:MAG TPA: YCF48-related protein [Polyangiaceae bacterium]|nr:YCF48-related protein [Polyangiaceae bacterium]
MGTRSSSSLFRRAVGRATLGGSLLLVLVASACKNSSPSGDGGSSAWVAAVGAQGAFVQTFDDVSWTARDIGAHDLYAVTCVGNLDGWAAGAGGAVAHTTDGGQTWTQQDARTTAALRAIRFVNAAVGVVAGDAGTLAVTTDAGATWKTVAPLTAASLRGVAVASSVGLMLAVGDGGVVLRSVDEGASFALTSIPGAGDLRSVTSDPGAHRVLAVDSNGSIWASTDAGEHFAREASAGPPLEAIALSDDGTFAIAAGAHGTVLERSEDGTWQQMAAGTTADLHAAVIVGEGTDSRHYVAGESGALLRSADRGATWSQVPTASGAALYSLDDL